MGCTYFKGNVGITKTLLLTSHKGGIPLATKMRNLGTPTEEFSNNTSSKSVQKVNAFQVFHFHVSLISTGTTQGFDKPFLTFNI